MDKQIIIYTSAGIPKKTLPTKLVGVSQTDELFLYQGIFFGSKMIKIVPSVVFSEEGKKPVYSIVSDFKEGYKNFRLIYRFLVDYRIVDMNKYAFQNTLNALYKNKNKY